MNKTPKKSEFNIAVLNPADVLYVCATSVIDRKVCEKLKIKFDEKLAQDLDEMCKFYFVVLKNLNYSVLPGFYFDEWVRRHNYGEVEPTEEARQCINHFIKQTHGIS